MNLTGVVGGEDHRTSAVTKWTFIITQRYQHVLDKSTPHVAYRWTLLAVLALIYGVRVYVVQGFYVITYGLGIYIIQLLIAFLSPQVDPEMQAITAVDDEDDDADDGGGPTLPTRGSDEFRPFVRRLPEFKFWYSLVKAVCFALALTFFSAFDVPVYWPILLLYWLVLFISTMKRQIMHMIKHRYVPFTLGKQRYTGKEVTESDDASIARP